MTQNLALVLAPVGVILRRFWASNRWLLASVGLVLVVSSVGSVAVPYVFSKLLDALAADQMVSAIAILFAGYAILRGLATAAAYAVNFLSMVAAENLNFITATAFFDRLVRKTVAFFIEHNPAEIQTAREKGQHSLYVIVQLGIITMVPGIAQIVLTIALLGTTINAEIVAIVVVYGVLFIAATYFVNKWTHPFLDTAIAAEQENASFVGSAVNAMETLRHFGGDRWISAAFGDKADEVRVAWGRWATRRMGFALIFGSGIAIQLAITFALLIPRYQAGELTIGDLVLINTLLVQLNQPFQMIGSAIDDLMRAWSRFLPFARMWAAPEEPDTGNTATFHLSGGRLAFEDVSFAYGERMVLHHVDFVAERGRMNFVVGPTGAGKSSLFKLALRSLEPGSGRITADGTDIAAVPRTQWYQSIGVVPQDVVLLNDTIASNILIDRARDDERLRRAVEKAAVGDFIARLPEGYKTKVGERGLKLSGGERQRIAIARALYAEPGLLFLDEASSALDEATEAAIMQELRALAGSVTVLAITHRKSVIRPEDNVLGIEAPSAPLAVDADNT